MQAWLSWTEAKVQMSVTRKAESFFCFLSGHSGGVGGPFARAFQLLGKQREAGAAWEEIPGAGGLSQFERKEPLKSREEIFARRQTRWNKKNWRTGCVPATGRSLAWGKGRGHSE